MPKPPPERQKDYNAKGKKRKGGKMPRPKTKDDRIHIKTTHEIKEQAFINAEKEHRTLSSYI